jgi:tRNA A-37 threonylcarbamoyl transferase component Bud32
MPARPAPEYGITSMCDVSSLARSISAVAVRSRWRRVCVECYNLPMAPELGPGVELAGFRVDRLIAAGGMGAVYLAHDATLDRRVALKVVAPALADDPRYRKRFLAEARLAASLEHPAIVPVYAAGESDDRLYLAMRFVDGGSVAGLLEARRMLPVDETLRLLGPVADALDAAHAAGLVHRDVKPGNILLDGEHAFLADFGLAVSSRAGSLLSADALQISGTMGYVAPEQIEGDPAGPAADQYGLACVVFECLAGRPPFPRDTELAVIYAHISEPPPSIAALIPDLPRELDRVIARGLAKRPADRFASCGDFVRAAATACGIATGVERRRRSARLWLALGCAAVVAVAAGVAVGIGARGGGGRSTSTANPTPAAAPTDAVTRFDPATGRRLAPIGVHSTPIAIAVGPQATWVLGADRTITAVGAQAAPIVGAAPNDPVDIAYGPDAFWMTMRSPNGGGESTVGDQLVRFDPTSFEQSAPLSLPGAAGKAVVSRGKQIAAGAGSVWVVAPDGSIERLDSARRSVRVIRLQNFDAGAVAFGDNAVWALGDHVGGDGGRDGPWVWRIDPITNTAAAPILVQAASASGLAVGGRAVWVADPLDGRIHRIREGPVNTTVATARGVSSLSFAGGHVVAANPVAGDVAIIDPATERVTHIRTSGTPVAIDADAFGAAAAVLPAAGAVASVPSKVVAGALDGKGCSAVVGPPGRKPDVLIVGDFPSEDSTDPAAIVSMLRESSFRAGRRTVGYQTCHGNEGPNLGTDFGGCQSRAERYAGAVRVVAVIEANTGDCVRHMTGAMFKAALPLVDIRNTANDLTDPAHGPGVGSIVHRVVGSDIAQAAGAMKAMKRLGATRIFVLASPPEVGDPRDSTEPITAADLFDAAASNAGLTVVDRQWFRPAGPDAIARAVQMSRADGVLISAPLDLDSGRLIGAVRARLDPAVPFLTRADLMPVDGLRAIFGEAAVGMYVSSLSPAPRALSSNGRRWLRRFALSQPGAAVPTSAPVAAQATQAVMQAITRSDGTRSSVLSSLAAGPVADSILSDFSFTPQGEAEGTSIAVWRVLPPASFAPNLPTDFQGTELYATIDVRSNATGG